MQVFVIGSPLETAIALDPKRLRKQIIEAQQILDALNGAKAWRNHPCVLQYEDYERWLECYKQCLESYIKGDVLEAKIQSQYATDWYKPHWHHIGYYTQMKRRLYTKNPEHYKQWEHLGVSYINWYWSQDENKFIKYENGKRIE